MANPVDGNNPVDLGDNEDERSSEDGGDPQARDERQRRRRQQRFQAGRGNDDPADGRAPAVSEYKTTRLPLFYGDRREDTITATNLCSRIEAYIASTNKDPNRGCNEMYMVLRKEGIEWWDMATDHGLDITNWLETKEAFIKHFEPEREAITSQFKVTQLRQKAAEPCRVFATRVSRMLRDMWKGFPREMQGETREARDWVYRCIFISGLRDKIRKELVKTEPPRNLMQLGEKVAEIELQICKDDADRPAEPGLVSALEQLTNSSKEEEEDEDEDLKLTEGEIAAFNQYRKSIGKKPFPAHKTGDRPRTDTRDVVCYNCKNKGHYAKDCRKAKDKRNQGRRVHAVEEDGASEEEAVSTIKVRPASNW